MINFVPASFAGTGLANIGPEFCSHDLRAYETGALVDAKAFCGYFILVRASSRDPHLGAFLLRTAVPDSLIGGVPF